MKKSNYRCPTCLSEWETYNKNPESLECTPCLVKGRNNLIVKTYELISAAKLSGADVSAELKTLQSLSPDELSKSMSL